MPDPATLPTTQRARRERIVAAAVELLDHAEYDDVQMRDVAERAGVALATVYRYFSSKEHLYAAAILRWSADFGPRAAALPRPDESDEDRLRALMRRAVRAFERSPQMFRAQMVIEMSTDPNARALAETFGHRHLAVLASALPGLDPEMARTVISVVNGVLTNYLRAWALGRLTSTEVDRLVQAAIDLIFHALPASNALAASPG